jgi:uncharacterized protein (PEP-CTERM system associated)
MTREILTVQRASLASIALVLVSSSALGQTLYSRPDDYLLPEPQFPPQPGYVAPVAPRVEAQPQAEGQPPEEAGKPFRAWTITPYVDLQEIFTDNVRLTPYNKTADLVTALTPGVGIKGQTRRLSVYLNGSATYDKYVKATDLDGWGYDVDGNALAEVAEKTLFLDLRSAISQAALNPGGVNSSVERNLPGNQIRVFNTSVSPYLQHDFAGWADGELRYRLSDSHYANASKGEGSSATTVPADATTNEFSTYLHSGPEFQRFRWAVDGSGANTGYSDSREFRQRSILGSWDYGVIREVAVLAKAGYESFSDNVTGTLSDAGAVWLGGLRLTPGPRTTLTVLGGRRYNAPYWYAELSYRLSAALLLTATHDVSVTTQQQQINTALNGLVRNSQGQLVDPTTGLPQDPNRLPFAFTDQPYTQETNRLTLSGELGLNRFELTGQYLQRDVGALGLNQSGIGHQTVVEGYGHYSRQLSRQSDANAVLGVSHTYDHDPSGENTIAYVGLAYGYNFSQTLRGTLSVRHYELIDRVNTGYRENVVLLGVHKEF